MEPQGAEPVVALAPKAPSVEPGSEVQLTATVHNPGGIVEEYSLDVLGVAAPWTTLQPSSLSAMPGESADVLLLVRPPRDPTTPAGPQAFGLRVTSQENPQLIAIGETQLSVGGVYELDARLVPVRDRARWKGRYTLDLVNRGSQAAQLAVSATDSRSGLSFAVAPKTVRVEPGGEAQVYLQLRARAPKLLGQPLRHSFTVTRTPTGPGIGAARAVLAGTHDGSFEQLPVLPRGVAAAAALLVVGFVLLVALVFKPADDAVASDPLPPPASALTGITALGSDGVRLEWRSNPYAESYLAQKLASPDSDKVSDSTEVKGDRNQFEWKELAPATEHCFRLVAKNAQGESVPSKKLCARTGAAPKPESSGSPTGGGEPTGGATPTSGGTPSGGGGEPTGGGSPTGGAEGAIVTGSYAVAGSYALADTLQAAEAQRVQALLTRAGVSYKFVKGDVAGLLFPIPDNVYVLVDNLPSQQAAVDKCTELGALDPVIRANCSAPR